MSPHPSPSSEPVWRVRFAIPAGGLLLLAALHHLTLHAPTQARISLLRHQIRSTQSATRKQEQSRARVPELAQQLARLTKELGERKAMLAHVGNRPLILKEVARRAETAGLKFVRFRPGQERQRAGYAVVPLELSLTGTFHDFIGFLRALGTTPQLRQFGSLTILSQKLIDRRVSLEILLEILTYRMPPPLPLPSLTTDLNESPGTFAATQADNARPEPESLTNIRDPFNPTAGVPCHKPGDGLQSYDLDELRLVGIVWEPHEPRGLVMDGAELSHVIVPGSPIGNRGGIVKVITPTRVVIDEPLSGGTNSTRSMSLEFRASTSKRPSTPADEQPHGHGERVNGRKGERDKSLAALCALE